MGRCSVFGCSNNEKTVVPVADGLERSIKFHRPPKTNGIIFNRWLWATGRDLSLMKTKKDIRFCEKHFTPEENDFIPAKFANCHRDIPKNAKMLPEKTIPTLHLPVRDPHISLNTELVKQRADRRASRAVNRILMAPIPASSNGGSSSILQEEVNSTISDCEDTAGTCGEERDFTLPSHPADELKKKTTDASTSPMKEMKPIMQTNYPYRHAAVKPVRPKIYESYEKLIKNLHGGVIPENFYVDHYSKGAGMCVSVNAQLLTDTLKKIDQLEADKKRALKKAERLEKEMHALREKYRKLTESIVSSGGAIDEKAKKMIIRRGLECSHIFTEGQINRMLSGGKRTRWEEDDYKAAIALYVVSSRAYAVAHKTKGIFIPSKSSLHRYMNKFERNPGLQKEGLLLLQSIMKSLLPFDMLVTLCFDEMKILRKVCYDVKHDKVMPHYDLVQVVFVRDLNGKFKFPIWYGFDAKMTREVWEEILAELLKIGLDVIAVTTDMGTSNTGFFGDQGVTPEHPFFTNVYTDRKIYVFFDPPHLLKLSRSNLMDNDYFLYFFATKGSRKATRQILEELIVLDSVNLPKVNAAHLGCLGQERQNVALAAQLMSSSVAKEIRKANRMGLFEKEDDAEATAEVVELMDAFFDIFNSRVVTPSAGVVAQKHPYGGEKKIEQDLLLGKIEELVENMKVGERPLKKGSTKISLLPFQKGILTSCRALKLMHLDLLERFPDQNICLQTYFLNQDCVEGFFSIMRASKNYVHPTSLEFTHRFRRYVIGRNVAQVINFSKANVKASPETALDVTLSENLNLVPRSIILPDEETDTYFLEYIGELENLEDDYSDRDWVPEENTEERSEESNDESSRSSESEEHAESLEAAASDRHFMHEILKHLQKRHKGVTLESLQILEDIFENHNGDFISTESGVVSTMCKDTASSHTHVDPKLAKAFFVKRVYKRAAVINWIDFSNKQAELARKRKLREAAAEENSSAEQKRRKRMAN